MSKDAIYSRYPLERPLDEDLGVWWVMHVKPNCEKIVASYMLNRNISYYLPLYKRKTRVGGLRRIREVEATLFSGYICFALDRDKHNLLYDTKKFVRIIKVEDQERFVQELGAIAKAIDSGEDLLVRPGLLPGKKVLILSGPLEGTTGVIVRSRLERQLALSVEMFNQSVLVTLEPSTKLELI
jgi:transcription antitermination factor NusG